MYSVCHYIAIFFGLLCLSSQAVVAADSSGRNSHFWITLLPTAGTASGADTDLVLANGYRSVDLSSPLLSCKRVEEGQQWIYEITWTGNSLISSGEADTLQFSMTLEAKASADPQLQSVEVNGADLVAKGFVVESDFERFVPRRVNGRRPPKGYAQILGSIVLRNPALQVEDPEHPFSDLKSGHTMKPTPYAPTTLEKLKAFPKFSWDKVPRCMLIRKSEAYTDGEIKAIADNYDLVVLEKANGAGKGNTSLGMLDTGARLKAINPDIKVLFYWNSRIFFGHYGIDNTIDQHKDEWIAKDFVIRGRLPTYVRENPDFLKWWVGCCEKMISHDAIDGTFVDKSGVPIYMLDALYKATPVNKLLMNNNSSARNRIGYVDGTYREGWSGGGNHDTIAETIAIAHETGMNQKMQILRNPIKRVSNPRELEDAADMSLAIYLLYVQEYSYFYVQASVDGTHPRWEWEASYLDQLNRPLGKPLGPYKRDNKVYTRSFEHCDVFMDLSSRGAGHAAQILWKNNVGDPTLAGSGMSSTVGMYQLFGSGAFSGNADQFFYLSDAHYGDGGVKAAVDVAEGALPNAKAGVMLRESLGADAAMVAVLRDPSGRMHMVFRPQKGAALISAGSLDAAQRPYAMVVRQGDHFVGYCSSDERDWKQIGEATVPMPEKIETGMAVASHDPGALAEARFSAFARIETSKKVNNDMDSEEDYEDSL